MRGDRGAAIRITKFFTKWEKNPLAFRRRLLLSAGVMTLAPRFLVNFWAGLRTARFLRRQKALGRGIEAQRAAFVRLVAQAAPTDFGRANRLAAGMSYEQFRHAVPPRTYAQFQPEIGRMAAGEENVLSPGRCRFFVSTAGTAETTPKLLPVTEPMLGHYRAGLRDAVFFHAGHVGHTGVFLGRHLHAGTSTALTEKNGAFYGSFDGLLALSCPPWVEANLYAPPPAIARLPEGPEKYAAICACLQGSDVTLLGGTPASVLALADAMRTRAGDGRHPAASLRTVWPNLECFVHTGAPLGLFAEPLRASLGPGVIFHELYAAAEGIVAAQDGDSAHGLRLLSNAGLFFEFLPLRDYNEDHLAGLGDRCLPLEQVQPDIGYAVFLTTPAGLCRYALGDVVRFLSVNPPRLVVTGRTKLHLDAYGERLGERELTETVLAVCHRNGWQPANFHAAPYASRAQPGLGRICHEWWVELRPGSVKTPTGPLLAQELDIELMRRNPDYAAKRRQRTLDSPVVRLVMPGTFDQWAQSRHALACASKMPRGRSDRLIADQLAALARFHSGSTQAPFVSTPPIVPPTPPQ